MPHSRFATRRLQRQAGAALAAAGAIALLLSGCTGADPAPSPLPSPSADAAGPIFGSDEEALAAASKSYATYTATVDQLTQDGGADPERIRPVVADDYAAELLESLQRLSESGNHTTGATTFDQMKLVQRTEIDGAAEVTTYVCIDVSAVRVLSGAGADVTPSERTERRPLVATFVSSTQDPKELLPSGSEQWSGDDFC
ncbi:hypothetical protein ACWGST_05870 [Agromyces sp. NPDC055520]